MIVDDMPMFLEYLRGCIDWNAYGFEICCEAKDGKQALELFPKYEPDIVLTDITMPYIDGLSLSEQIITLYPETAVVLITGNNEFEYARRAVKIGVCDYIVKPFEKEELILCLLKLQDNISKALEMKSEKEDISSNKEMVLRKVIFAEEDQIEDCVKELEAEHIQFETPYFIICTIKINAYDSIEKFERVHQWKDVLLNIVKDMVQVEGHFEVFRDFENSIITVLNFKDEQTMKKYKEYEFQDLIKMIKEHLAFDIAVGVSDYCYGIDKLKEGYYQTLQVLNTTTMQHGGKILDYKKLKLEEQTIVYCWDIIERINKHLELLNYNKIQEIIEIEGEAIDHYNNPQVSLMIYMSILSSLFSYMIKVGRNIEDVFGADLAPFETLRSEIDFKAKRAFILNCYEKAITYQSQNIDEKAYQVAEGAKAYVHNHYMSPDLTIADISKALLVNQTYLRKMFKSEMNMTLSEYITQYRMERAKSLIKENHLKLAVVAEQVGYSDVSYFSKCFKKYYGVSPKVVNGGRGHEE